MKNALRPSLLCLTTCLLVACTGLLCAQSSQTETKKVEPIATPLIASAPVPTACSDAVNYGVLNTVGGLSSATTSVSKSMWYQCASADATNARTYFDRVALEIPLAKPVGEGLDGFGKNPSITPSTAPVSVDTIGPPLKPGLVLKDNNNSSTLPKDGKTSK